MPEPSSEPRWLDDDESRAWRAYRAMSARVGQLTEQQLVNDWGMSGADYAVLVALSEAPQRRLRARDLARGLSWERSRLSHQLRRMEQRGLVTKEDCPGDARGTIFVLAETGFDLIRQAAPSHVAQVRNVLIDALDTAEQRALADISEKVVRHLDGLCEGKAPADDACDETGPDVGAC